MYFLKETVSGSAAEQAYEHFKNYLGIVEPSQLEASIVPYVISTCNITVQSSQQQTQGVLFFFLLSTHITTHNSHSHKNIFIYTLTLII